MKFNLNDCQTLYFQVRLYQRQVYISSLEHGRTISFPRSLGLFGSYPVIGFRNLLEVRGWGDGQIEFSKAILFVTALDRSVPGTFLRLFAAFGKCGVILVDHGDPGSMIHTIIVELIELIDPSHQHIRGLKVLLGMVALPRPVFSMPDYPVGCTLSASLARPPGALQ